MCRLPKQYPAVPAMTWPPRPALWTSLIRPPVPVVAPLNGATPRDWVGRKLLFGKQHKRKRAEMMQITIVCFVSPDQLGSCASLQ